VGLAVHQRRGFYPSTLERVCQRQVRQDAVVFDIANAGANVFVDVLSHLGDALKAVHHTLWRAGGARGIQQDGDVRACTRYAASQRCGARHDGVPALVTVLGCQREGNARQGCRYAGLLRGPSIKLAHKQQAGATVLQHIADGLSRLRRENSNRGATRHPDGQLGHEKMCAILGQNGNTCSGLQALGFDVGRHAARLVQGLLPGVINDFVATHWLGQIDPLCQLGLVVINIVQNQFGFGHRVSPYWLSQQNTPLLTAKRR